MASYDDQVSTLDGIEKIDYLLKKDFQVTTTKETTLWFDENKGKSLSTIESDSINIVEPPDEPIWEDASMTDASLAEYGVNVNVSASFHSNTSDEFTTVQEAYYNDGDATKYYRHNGTYTPGAYLDSTKTLILFVALRLDFMETSTSSLNRNDETISGQTRLKSLAFTKYPNDSSLNSVLSNSFQTNYKKQVDILDGEGEAQVSGLNPYRYTLQYPNSSNIRQAVSFPTGNWFFDFKSGIITFSDDPGSDYKFDDPADEKENLYLTFVKYVGPTGLKKMLSVDPDFASNSSNSGYYEDQVVIDSTNSKIYLRKDNAWEEIETGSPDSNGIGMGFYPIGAVITWPGTSGPPSDYGTWLLCNGASKNYNDYPVLGALFGSSSGGTFALPNYNNIFIRSTANSLGTSGGNNEATLSASNLPKHTHDSIYHTHSLTANNHTHTVNNHTHTFNLPLHNHADGNVFNHTHEVTKEYTHTHSNNNSNHTASSHTHKYSIVNAVNVTGYTEKGTSGSNAVTGFNTPGDSENNTGSENLNTVTSNSASIELAAGSGEMTLGNAQVQANTGSALNSNSNAFSSTSEGDGAYNINFSEESAGDTGQNGSNVDTFSILPSYTFTSYYIRAN